MSKCKPYPKGLGHYPRTEHSIYVKRTRLNIETEQYGSVGKKTVDIYLPETKECTIHEMAHTTNKRNSSKTLKYGYSLKR